MNKERVREPLTSPPTPEYIRQKAEEGWTLSAVEWERSIEIFATDAGSLKEEIPYGLRVSIDCRHLEEGGPSPGRSALFYETPYALTVVTCCTSYRS